MARAVEGFVRRRRRHHQQTPNKPPPRLAHHMDDEDIPRLSALIAAQTPPSGTVDLSAETSASKFKDLPLSSPTLAGLKRGGFSVLTDIQRVAIPHALAGRDILGAAKTGSGKTLAFLVPMVEDLYRARWSREDRIGALVVSPTRELALQIFEVLKVLAHEHAFSVCMLVGGSDFAVEQKRAARTQVAVCTPGRLLQHLEQTASFDATNVRVLVLDEADRLLDLGFSEQLQAILSYMPSPRSAGGERQTMLFSATQTNKSVSDLARLSLADPEYVSVHRADKEATPAGLRQSFTLCPLPNKLDLVWSFIRSHLKNKTIVFFSSCSQVRFVDAAFRRLRPGVPVMALHGKIKALKRTLVYQDFVARPAAVLLATDLAARGLDFPQVDWVLQADCPEDTASYIHRAGRTARYKQGGNALLVLTPDESRAFLPQLAQAKVTLKKLGVNPEKVL
jgi:ATP-dependent RNA helicase DDX10/DBP4